MCIVVDKRISLKRYRGESRRFASAGRQQSWTRYGECRGHHRGLRAGHAAIGGTRELGRATCLLDNMPGVGDRVTKGPGVPWELPPGHEPVRDTTNARKQARYRGSERQAKRPERDRVAVVAAHSTGEGGEVRPKRPTGGKAPSGRASTGGRQGRDFELTNPDHGTPVDCGARG